MIASDAVFADGSMSWKDVWDNDTSKVTCFAADNFPACRRIYPVEIRRSRQFGRDPPCGQSCDVAFSESHRVPSARETDCTSSPRLRARARVMVRGLDLPAALPT